MDDSLDDEDNLLDDFAPKEYDNPSESRLYVNVAIVFEGMLIVCALLDDERIKEIIRLLLNRLTHL